MLLEGLVRAGLIPPIFSQEKSPGWLCKNYWAGCWAQSSSHRMSPGSPLLSQALLRLFSVPPETREPVSCCIIRSTILTICPFCFKHSFGNPRSVFSSGPETIFLHNLGQEIKYPWTLVPILQMGSTLLYLFRLSAQRPRDWTGLDTWHTMDRCAYTE